MVQAAEPQVSYEQYLDAERQSTVKHEWLDGVIYVIAGGTLEHSRLASRMNAALDVAFPGCTVFQSDAMSFVLRAQLSTYADVVVVCGPVESRRSSVIAGC
jgi:Uma2 family endonuclease